LEDTVKIQEKIPEPQVNIPRTSKPVLIPAVKNPVLSYSSLYGTGRSAFQVPEYDLVELGKVLDTEAFVRQAIAKKTALMFKEGWDMVGPNLQTITYIKTRLAQTEQASGLSTKMLFRAVGASLILKSNAFLLKVRKTKASGGKIRTLPQTNKELEPVAAYFPVPAETMECQLVGNKVSKWRQHMPDGSYRTYKPEDVIHFYHDRKDGFLYGTPLLVPVLDDIRALRKIEENLELLIYQHLFPLFQYKVGTPESPAGYTEDGYKEIDVVKAEIQRMPTEGGIVTPERHDIKAIGAEGRALRAEGYLKHFKQRVIAGLGISSVDLGEGECYSDDTQTLTENGWKYHYEIDHTKEKIAVFNPDIWKVEYRFANYKYANDYTGEMIHIQGQHLDIQVTPHHRMWVKAKWRDSWEIIEAKELLDNKYGTEFYVLESAPLEDKNLTKDRFFIKASKAKRGGPCKSISCQLVDFAEFLGYFISEGCIDKSNGNKGFYRTLISQNKGANLDLICQNADRIGLSYSKIKSKKSNQSGIKIYGKTLYSFLRKNVPHGSKNKRIPLFALEWPQKAREALLQALVIGDGWDEGLGKFKTYYTSSKGLADDVQILALSLGYNAKVVLVEQDQAAWGKNPMWRVYISSPRTSVQHRLVQSQMITSKEYSGGIYCYNVPHHLYITRRNGKVTIQGNTVNRSTSDNLSRNLIDSVKDYQQVFETFFNTYVINELLLESTYGDDVLNEENKCFLRFKEIDIDVQIKKEAHYADQFNKNIITLDETRRLGCGLEPLRIPSREDIEAERDGGDEFPEWNRTNWKLYEEPKLLIQSLDEPWSALAKAVARSSSLITTESDIQTAKTETQEKDIELEKQKAAIAKAKQKKNVVTTRPSRPKSRDGYLANTFDLITEGAIAHVQIKGQLEHDWVGQLIRAQMETTIQQLIAEQVVAFRSGYLHQGGAVGPEFIQRTAYARTIFTERANHFVTKLTNDIVSLLQKRVDNLEPLSNIALNTRSVFSALRYRTAFIEDVEVRKGYGFGQLVRWRDTEVVSLKLENTTPEPCDDCLARSRELYNPSLMDIDDIPPFHANCGCVLLATETSVQDAHKKTKSTLGPKSKKAQFVKCVMKTKTRLRVQHPDWSEEQLEIQAETACDHVLQDITTQNKVKLEHYVQKVKTRLEQDHPGWSEDKIELSALAICSNGLKGK